MLKLVHKKPMKNIKPNIKHKCRTGIIGVVKWGCEVHHMNLKFQYKLPGSTTEWQ